MLRALGSERFISSKHLKSKLILFEYKMVDEKKSFVKTPVNPVIKPSKDDSKLFAFLAVFLSIIGFIIAIVVKKDDEYVMFYAKQGLVLFVVAVIINVVGMVIPFIGWFIILPLGGLFTVVLWVIQMIYSVSGEKKLTPIIGIFAEKINF